MFTSRTASSVAWGDGSVGYSAQGIEDDTRPYVATEASNDPRASFMFEGVDRGEIGAEGPVGAAGGYELDRADIHLGTPPHALVVARTASFDGLVNPVNEERLTDRLIDAKEPLGAEITFFEGPQGGATLAVGSVMFAGTLGEGTSAERLVDNALYRFLQPHLFETPRADSGETTRI